MPASPDTTDLFLSKNEDKVLWVSGGCDNCDSCDGSCGGEVGPLRAIHEVISSALPDLVEEGWCSGGSGLPRGSVQFFHVGWDWKPGLVGLVE